MQLLIAEFWNSINTHFKRAEMEAQKEDFMAAKNKTSSGFYKGEKRSKFIVTIPVSVTGQENSRVSQLLVSSRT